MSKRLVLVAAAAGALLAPGRARACDPEGPNPHVIDPAMVGVDQVPPQLPQPEVGAVQHYEAGGDCGTPKCGWPNGVAIRNLATDDMTPADQIGYRMMVVAGSVPSGLSLPMGTENPRGAELWLYWDGDSDVDFTLQLVAVDAAGNESAPQTVRVLNDTGGCNVGRKSPGELTLVIVAFALAAALRRPRRRG